MRRGYVATAYLEAAGSERGAGEEGPCALSRAALRLYDALEIGSPWGRLAWRWRCRLAGSEASDSGAIAVAMLLGHKDLIAPELQEAFSRAGISHLLAVSGLHMGFVLAMALPFIARVQGPAGTAGRWARARRWAGFGLLGATVLGYVAFDRRAGLCRPGGPHGPGGLWGAPDGPAAGPVARLGRGGDGPSGLPAPVRAGPRVSDVLSRRRRDLVGTGSGKSAAGGSEDGRAGPPGDGGSAAAAGGRRGNRRAGGPRGRRRHQGERRRTAGHRAAGRRGVFGSLLDRPAGQPGRGAAGGRGGDVPRGGRPSGRALAGAGRRADRRGPPGGGPPGGAGAAGSPVGRSGDAHALCRRRGRLVPAVVRRHGAGPLEPPPGARRPGAAGQAGGAGRRRPGGGHTPLAGGERPSGRRRSVGVGRGARRRRAGPERLGPGGDHRRRRRSGRRGLRRVRRGGPPGGAGPQAPRGAAAGGGAQHASPRGSRARPRGSDRPAGGERRLCRRDRGERCGLPHVSPGRGGEGAPRAAAEGRDGAGAGARPEPCGAGRRGLRRSERRAPAVRQRPLGGAPPAAPGRQTRSFRATSKNGARGGSWRRRRAGANSPSPAWTCCWCPITATG